MADYTAFMEAGESLVELLRAQMSPEPVGSPELISLCSPHESENNQVTVFLFHVEEDTQGAQAGYYQHSKQVERMRPARFQLHFLITANSKAPAHTREADKYRVLGAVVQILKDNPALPKQYLRGSLSETEADLRISVERPNYEQMTKTWNNTAAPYKLSLLCKVAGVEIDSKRERARSRVTDVQISLEEKP
jgi:hypothetical protein